MKTTTYNGHKNWTQWNVALWIGNDESLYRLARTLVRHHRTRKAAAAAFVQAMAEYAMPATPDGARYSMTAVLAAMKGL